MLKEYLESMGNGIRNITRNPRHVSMESYVLKYGKEYTSTFLTWSERSFILEILNRGSWMEGQCYMNAQKLAQTHSNLKYVEGYCLRGFPFIHAWVTYHGKVIDPTLRRVRRGPGPLDDRILGNFPADYEYYGIEFAVQAVAEHIEETLIYGSLIDDFERGWPLLKKEAANAAVQSGGKSQAEAPNQRSAQRS